MTDTIFERRPLFRRTRGTLLTASLASLIAVAIATPSLAQTAPAAQPPAPPTAQPLPSDTPPAPQADAVGQDIVVTGSRITTGGFTAPTPTQSIGAADIARNAEPNVFTTIAQLPSLQGSSGVTTGTNSTSSGQQGLSSFSLRGLGTIRTLTLLDSQRVVGANVTGVPDISLFPQLLIKRVDVVTGGASASYGSDAVGGVVNFITDKRFVGFKANVQGGITTYGDNKQGLFQAAVGRSFFNDRLHVQVSGEYDHEDGVPAGGFGEELAGGRTWYRTSTFINRNVTNDGSPQYLVRDHAQAYQYTKYGLITNGPLQGTAFNAAGQPFQFQYGSNGVPSKTAAGTVSGCYTQGGFCLGGDLSGNVGIGTTLQSRLDRYNGYGRVGFDVDANNEIYATVNIAQVDTMNQPNPGATKSGLTLQCANPFVPASIQAACASAGITQFQFGTSNGQLPNNISVYPTRKQYRFVGGAAGKVPVFGTTWNYDISYEHGENITDIHVKNILLTNRYAAAIQAINLGGQIVCADPVARANGCVPINIIGGATPSAAALAYIEPANGPFQHTRQTQDAFNFSFSGSPLSLWAGPVSVAAGAEYRNEFYHVTGDPYGNGVSAETPYSSAYPADPVLNTAGNNWYAGNYHAGRGSYHVAEGFLEVNLPFLKSDALGSANLNVAGRVTNYSTSGTVYTWKVGGTWDTPIDGVRLRAVTSRDVRAPNLSELFAAPITTTVPNFSNPNPNRAPGDPATLTILQNAIGNTALKPEIARNTTAGIVLSRPHWLPGFSASFDYYRIKINGVISTLNSQQEVNLCYLNNITSLCGAFNLTPPAGTAPYVNLQAFNLASIFTDGFDIEASYQFGLGKVGLPGRVVLRGLATNVKNYITDPGVPGTIPTQSAGVNAGNTPSWKLLATEAWNTDTFSLSVQQRWFSDGVYNNEYVVCSTGCPVSTTQHPTIDNNSMPGAFYLDIGGSYNITKKLNVYFKIDNLLDHDPAPSPQTNTGIDTNQALYDTLGRLFRIGARYNF
ncbi:TonB-dependent receptor plug domain-containing protein [Sphingomonas glacialis]|uniref:TonB-dependent receptor n=1 Tax=Sphingomonas glacialis TaxID=658225 RepID=A0A502G4B5_9SPHN|nr:TonB-dependent receptor [Sphingomonas glacialis]TPG56411.1 TonB-dependent receptor [Sphingomonas glacialis]